MHRPNVRYGAVSVIPFAKGGSGLSPLVPFTPATIAPDLHE